jgi:hypothetical protein
MIPFEPRRPGWPFSLHMRRLLADDPARDILQFDVFEMPRAVVGTLASRP